MAGLAAFQYVPKAFDRSGPKLMGRDAAIEAMLKAWVQHSGADPLTAWADRRDLDQAFADHIKALGGTVPTAVAHPTNEQPLIDAGALWLLDPHVSRRAWHRRYGAQDRWSIVGVTHTTATHSIMEAIAELLTAPVQPWDALICTSQAVRDMAQRVIELQADYLRARFGAREIPMPRLPVIPLGVHGADFETGDEARARWRDQLGIGADDIVVLQLGRLSFHGKAHPGPLYLSLAAAAQKSGKRPHLIFAGWFTNTDQENCFTGLAREFSEHVETHFVDGRLPDARRSVWAAADIFALLVDNIQETFGLAPIEAMAAGLPVVVSDWDGYKDTVEPGVSGFRIPTIQPPPGGGAALAQRYDIGIDSYDEYVGSAAQAIAFDIGQAASAFARLFADADLRRRMGEAGRARVAERFEWKVVVGQYRDLLAELAERRRAGGEVAPRMSGEPVRASRADPFDLFRSYPSLHLQDAMRLRVTETAAAGLASAAGGLGTALPVPQAMPRRDQLEQIIATLTRNGPMTVAQLLEGSTSRAVVQRGLVWLIKFGFVTLAG